MSADNYVRVLRKVEGHTTHYYNYIVVYGCASIDEEDCQYVGRVVSVHDTREKALAAAHNYADKLPVLEYGVSEGIYPDETPCGRCYVCITERGIVAKDIQRCTACGNPIH